jgi:hypothetical protein
MPLFENQQTQMFTLPSRYLFLRILVTKKPPFPQLRTQHAAENCIDTSLLLCYTVEEIGRLNSLEWNRNFL